MLKELVLQNRSCRGFDRSRKVTREELLSFVDLARHSASAMNLQVLRYRLVTEEDEVARVQAQTMWGRALPELDLPFPGQGASAFIVMGIDKTLAKNENAFGVDVGISAQTMALAATEAGLSALMIESFNHAGVARELSLPETFSPFFVMAFGKSAERAVVEDMPKGGSHKYYRDAEGVHHVPKRRLCDVVIG